MIEARWLFDIEMARVQVVVVHPQSVVHSMVEYRRRLDHRAVVHARHVPAHPVCADLSPPAMKSDRVQTNFAPPSAP